MAQNTLKQKARSFSQTHGVSYLTALHAVDEPLHELRDLAAHPHRLAVSGSVAVIPHFRLVGEQSIYSAAFEIPVDPLTDTELYGAFIAEEGFSRFFGISDLIKEMGRRLTLLEDASAESIWEYRALHRAGILGDSAPKLDVFFHHFGKRLQTGYENLKLQGAELGLFAVSIAEYMLLEEDRPLIPLRREQLSALSSGAPAGTVELPVFHQKSSYAEENLRWEARYDLIAWSYKESGIHPKLQILFSEMPSNRNAALVELGLNPGDFSFEEINRDLVLFEHVLYGDRLRIRRADRYYYNGHSQAVLIV